jgi:hypothetical protein
MWHLRSRSEDFQNSNMKTRIDLVPMLAQASLAVGATGWCGQHLREQPHIREPGLERFQVGSRLGVWS